MFWKKIKPAKMFVDYTPMDAMIYLKATAPQRVYELSETAVYPFFIKLLKNPFENWVIEIQGIDAEDSFSSVVNSVPKTVTDKQYKKLQKELKSLLSAVMSDILSQALEPLSSVKISHEEKK